MGGGVQDADDGGEIRRADRSDAHAFLQDFTLDPRNRQIGLIRGVVLDALDGNEKSLFLAVKDRTSIAARTGGGDIGASSRGRIDCGE